MFQGKEEARNHAPFGFDPKEVDAVLLTHAHLDHVGRLPKLFREGYRGPVYATRATVLLMEIVLEDALKVMDEPFFGPEDVEEALGHLRPLEYGEWLRLGGECGQRRHEEKKQASSTSVKRWDSAERSIHEGKRVLRVSGTRATSQKSPRGPSRV
mgnify:FL=1